MTTVPSQDLESMQVWFEDDLEKALDRKNRITTDAYIIGGASIFKQTFNDIDGIYMTKIEQEFKGDTYYPKIPAQFKEESKTLLQESPKLELVFLKNQNK